MAAYLSTSPTREACWRSVVLFGRNVASYKFALGKSLLDLAAAQHNFVSLEELAGPFSRHVCEHLRLNNRQATSASSAFLEGCRAANCGDLDADALRALTVRRGFDNVVDAFHVVAGGDVPRRFFVDERRGRGGLVLTDELLAMAHGAHAGSLPREVEARWRLVETAWLVKLPPRLLQVRYDEEGSLYIERSKLRRINVTSARDALSGYQGGCCFYCGEILGTGENKAVATVEVDHFIPWRLLAEPAFRQAYHLDGVWNLVLACGRCNGAKLDRLPAPALLGRLHARNESIILSHHPLRETILNQTGMTEPQRADFLGEVMRRASEWIYHSWESPV